MLFRSREPGARSIEMLQLDKRVVTESAESDDGQRGEVPEIKDGRNPGVLNVPRLEIERFQCGDLSDMLDEGRVVGIFRFAAVVVSVSTFDPGRH